MLSQSTPKVQIVFNRNTRFFMPLTEMKYSKSTQKNRPSLLPCHDVYLANTVCADINDESFFFFKPHHVSTAAI